MSERSGRGVDDGSVEVYFEAGAAWEGCAGLEMLETPIIEES